MAIKTIVGITPYWYTPETEKEESNPARFRLVPLNSEQLDQAMEGAKIEDNGLSRLTPTGIRSALVAGISEWENVESESGALPCIPANHKYLPWVLRLSLASEIVNSAMLREGDLKN